MGKQRPSLASIAALAQPEPAVLQEVTEPKPETRRRSDKPHASLYLDRSVIRVLKEIALPYDKKCTPLLIEGVDLVLQKVRSAISRGNHAGTGKRSQGVTV